MKDKLYHTVGTVSEQFQISYQKSQKEANRYPLHKYTWSLTFLYWHRQFRKKDGDKLLLRPKTFPLSIMMQSCKCFFPHTSEMRLCKRFPHEGFSVPFVSFMHFVWHIRRRRGYPLWHNPTYSHLSERSFRSFMWHCCYFSI